MRAAAALLCAAAAVADPCSKLTSCGDCYNRGLTPPIEPCAWCVATKKCLSVTTMPGSGCKNDSAAGCVSKSVYFPKCAKQCPTDQYACIESGGASQCAAVPAGTAGAGSREACESTCGVQLYACVTGQGCLPTTTGGVPQTECAAKCGSAPVPPAPVPPRAGAWADCDAAPSTSPGPFAHTFLNTSWNGSTYYGAYPTAPLPAGAAGWPVVVFMHGMTLGWEWYESHVARWASHGVVVLFPFVKSPEQDDGVVPVTQTSGESIIEAFAFARAIAGAAAPPLPGLQGALDLGNQAIAGHSMGGENAIRAAAKLPAGTLRATVAQHPSLCGAGPPPWPVTIGKKEINEASQKGALLLFTASNDRAFLPGTPAREHGCWAAAKGPAIFAEFNNATCKQYPECSDMTGAGGCDLKITAVGKGHMCACEAPGVASWVSPELRWVTTALRLYLQHGNRTASACSALLWGAGAGALRNDPATARVEVHGALPNAPGA